jgi:hypothetical protein
MGSAFVLLEIVCNLGLSRIRATETRMGEIDPKSNSLQPGPACDI